MTSVIITGASAGIGAACADAFLEAGWQVGLLARRAEALEAVANGRDNAILLPADVTAPDQVEAAFARFIAVTGRLDVLFNNAGMFGQAGMIDDIPLDSWHDVLAVNVTGMFLCARAAFGQMRRQQPRGGRIINNGSVSAHVPRPGAVTYTTTKHAITGLTRQLSLDGRPLNIACGQIDIGNALTPMLQDLNDRMRAENPEAEPQASMSLDDAVASVQHMAGLPLNANVQFMTVMATQMPYIGRG